MKGSSLYFLIFGLLLLLFSIIFTLNVVFKTQTDFFHVAPIEKKIVEEKPGEEEPGWTRYISEKEPEKELFPAEEIILSWDLVKADTLKDTLYKMSFQGLDKYQYFCLVQVLNSHQIKRSIEKKGDEYRIYLSLYSPSAAKVLLNELKEYDIYGQITKYKSEIKYKE